MSAPSNFSWADLFTSKSPADFTLELRVIKKSGQPFLFVPSSSSLAAHALSLYPAQTTRAKLARSALRTTILSRIPLALEKSTVTLASKDPFPKFLANLVNAATLPPLAILAGNPGAEGRRFVLLLFDKKRQPAFVVKAGIGDSARQLIRHEAAFLHSAPPGTLGLPLLRGSFDTGAVSAFALEYVDGNSPNPEVGPGLVKLLSSWVNQERQIKLRETRGWQSLESTAVDNPLFRTLAAKLANTSVHPAIYHGDLAPWNIKVARDTRNWCVLDWERGDLNGIPGWDWFHYVIQSAILIQKQSAEQVAAKVEELMASPLFQNYASLAGIPGSEKSLAVAYLLYLTNVIRPSEGIETNHALLSLLSRDLSV